MTNKLMLMVVAVMATLLVTSITAAKLTDTQAQGLFVEFARRYNKSYELADFFKRFEVFRDNVQWIIDFNEKKDRTHEVGVNFFADMTPEEWQHYKGLKIPNSFKEPDYAAMDKREEKDDEALIEMRRERGYGQEEGFNWKTNAPDAFDWSEQGTMLPIRNQQSCGSCYSFSAMATVEALRAITFPDDPKEYLSTQQGIDCTRSYGCYGCQGGWMTSVFEYLVDAGGVCLEKDYPYKNRVGTCQAKNCSKAFKFNKYRDISGAKPEAIMEHLIVNPQAIAVTSGTREFMYYKSGVISNCGGSRDQQVDHAVVLVGFSAKESTDSAGTTIPAHVKIRNSWGAGWGENGHVRVAINNNTCKYRANVSYPVIAAPATTPTAPNA